MQESRGILQTGRDKSCLWQRGKHAKIQKQDYFLLLLVKFLKIIREAKVRYLTSSKSNIILIHIKIILTPT